MYNVTNIGMIDINSVDVLGKKSSPERKKLKKTRNVTKRNTRSGRGKKEKKRKNKSEGSKKNIWVAIKPIRRRLYPQSE